MNEKISFLKKKRNLTALLEQGCEFEGKLCFYGVVRVNAVVRGEVYTPDTLVIGEEGKVEGNVYAGVVIISGNVQGRIEAKQRVEIYRPAVFHGEIFTPSLSVEEGVHFEGKSFMLSHIQHAKQVF